MSEARKKVIDQREVVAGFFREALFHNRSLQISFAGKLIEGRLVGLDEESTRHSNDKRTLKLALVGEISPENVGVPAIAQIKCSFPHFVAQWEGPFYFESRTSVVVALPDSLTIQNQRSSNRLILATAGHKDLSVLVSTNGKYIEGNFVVENHSDNGCGGVLTIFAGFEIVTGTRIQGRLHRSDGGLKVDGVIAQAQLVDSNPSVGESRYRIGLKADGSMQAGPSGSSDRRKVQRIRVSFPLMMNSPLCPSHPIELELKDASVSGFSGCLTNKADKVLLSVALIVKIRDEEMLAEVVSQQDDIIRFQIVSGSSENRLRWLNRLTRFRPDMSSSTGVGAEIIDLFCESGAFSSKFLAEQARYSKDVLSGLVADEATSSWVHRWIERTTDGDIKGHCSAIRFSDQLWHLGDIAGMRRESHKVSKSFIPGFFRNFREYCLSLQPCPRVVISWVEGHPYWRKFEQHLRSNSAAESFAIRAEYVRLYKSEVSNVSTWRLEEVSSGDFRLIDSIQDQLKAPEYGKFLRALDFSAESFGSPILSALLSKAKVPFHRKYVLAKAPGRVALVIFHSFPAGICPQRSIEVPWIIPVVGDLGTVEGSRDLMDSVRAFGLRNGFRFPGLLLASTAEGSEKTPTKKMIWTVGHPKILEFFDEQT